MKVAEEIFNFTKYARISLGAKKTPFLLMGDDQFLDGFIDADSLAKYIKANE